jgi:leader peptidase (prepilin peptidase)/N-methyltransferase
LLTTLLSVATFIHFKEMAHYLVYFSFLVVPLVVVSFIDLEHRIIPDVISLPGIIAGVLTRFAFSRGNWTDVGVDILLGVAIGMGFLCIVGYGYEIIKKQEGLGGGDVKLAGMLGAFFGWKAIIFIYY